MRIQEKDKYKFLAPTVVVCAALVAFPFIYMLYTSVQYWVAFRPGRSFTGLSNYKFILISAEFRQSLITTAIFVLASVTLSIVIGFLLALILNERFRGRNVVRALLTIPAIIPPAAAGFTWKFLLDRDVGVLGGFLLPLVGIKEALLGNPSLALSSVIVADVWCQTPLMFLIILAGLQAVPIELFEAARIDGASFGQLLRKIIIPLLRPVLGLAVIIRFIFAFTTFDVIFTMTKGGPGIATQTLPLLGWKTGFLYYDLGQAAALAVIMMIITVFFSFLLVKTVKI